MLNQTKILVHSTSQHSITWWSDQNIGRTEGRLRAQRRTLCAAADQNQTVIKRSRLYLILILKGNSCMHKTTRPCFNIFLQILVWQDIHILILTGQATHIIRHNLNSLFLFFFLQEQSYKQGITSSFRQGRQDKVCCLA